MKRLIMLLLAGVLLSATIVMAQEQTKPADTSTATGTYPAATPPPQEEPQQKPPAQETPALSSDTRIYRYEFTDKKGATHWATSTKDPSEFENSLPKGWTPDFKTAWTYEYTSPEAAKKIVATAQELKTPPIDIYDGKAIFVLDSKEIAILEGDVRYEYSEKGDLKKVIRPDAEITSQFASQEIETAKSLYDEAQARQTTKDIVGFFSQLTWYFQQYKGMAGWSSLFFDEEFLEDWKQGVNTFFCNTIILGGTDCWVSKICGSYADITPSKNGVLFITSAGGGIEPMAHIEGQRSLPIETPEGQSWVYTITFGIRNSGDETMSYNVRFSGPQKSAVWWDSPQPLPKGLTASATGGSALIKHSNNDYREVCLEFSPAIRPFGSTDIIGGGVSKICNNIVQPSGTATAPYSTANTTTQQVCITTALGKQCGIPAQTGTTPATQPSTPGGNV